MKSKKWLNLPHHSPLKLYQRTSVRTSLTDYEKPWTEFFTFFVIFLNLCINTRLARLYIILMAFAFYCVGCAKAFLCLPRPRLPLVKPLESALDWALPSNHAVMATCLPLYVWFYSYLHQAQLGLTSGMLINSPDSPMSGLVGGRLRKKDLLIDELKKSTA